MRYLRRDGGAKKLLASSIERVSLGSGAIDKE